MIKLFEQYVFESKISNNDLDKAFSNAKKYLLSIHKKVNEDHIIDFMIGYMFNNYGVDLTHGKHIYNFIKHYVHLKLKASYKKN